MQTKPFGFFRNIPMDINIKQNQKNNMKKLNKWVDVRKKQVREVTDMDITIKKLQDKNTYITLSISYICIFVHIYIWTKIV